MFDWQPEVNLKKKDPFCLPPPPHTSSTSSGNSSLSNCAENVPWKPEFCVYSPCQPMPFTPSLPWTSLSQRTTTRYFSSEIHKEQDRPRKPEQCVQPSSPCFLFYTFVHVSKDFERIPYKQVIYNYASPSIVYGKYSSPKGFETVVLIWTSVVWGIFNTGKLSSFPVKT